MESACLSPCEDGLPPPTTSTQWPAGTAHVAPNIANTWNGGSAAAMDVDHQPDSSCINHLLLQKLITQRLAAACTPSLPFASTSGKVNKMRNSMPGAGARPSREYSERKAVVKDGAPSSNSSDKKRSSPAAAAAAGSHGRGGAENNGKEEGGGLRVRARRGEATDQHSVAERTRRTKIAVRMRALHRLIPDASKTNKASMLDEVIQYVSMLQARLKMECTRKVDARGEAALFAMCGKAPFDIEAWAKSCNRVYVNEMIERVLDPQEERLAEVERQVMSRLSHPNLNLSQTSTYLASLGLALLPISLLPNSSPPPPNTDASHA